MQELLRILHERLDDYWPGFKDEGVRLKYYGYDKRIGWDTYLVTIVDEASGRPVAVGYTDGAEGVKVEMSGYHVTIETGRYAFPDKADITIEDDDGNVANRLPIDKAYRTLDQWEQDPPK